MSGVGTLNEQQLTSMESTSTGPTNFTNLNMQIKNNLVAKTLCIANSNVVNESDLSSPTAFVGSRVVNTEDGTISGSSYLQNSTLLNSGNIPGILIVNIFNTFM